MDQFSATMILVGFIVFLFLVIMLVVWRSALRSRQQFKAKQPTKPLESAKAVPKEAPAELLVATKDEPEPKPELEIKGDVDVDLHTAMSRTREGFWGRLRGLFQGAEASLDDVEEILYTSDLGPRTVERLLNKIRPHAKDGVERVKFMLKQEFLDIFSEAKVDAPGAHALSLLSVDHMPAVWMIVGVNGAGKTTSIGKISAILAKGGKRVLVAAGDTFRAAAGSQLKVWTERAQVEIFAPEGTTDPSAVAFDAVSKAKSKGFDIVLIDTAGRLHTQSNLMEELRKVKRVLSKVSSDAPCEVLLVLDANNGQNALHQAREFHSALGVTGIILTKMDGSAKGGVALAVAEELKIPIRLIGVGERLQDLRAFSAPEFVESLFSDEV